MTASAAVAEPRTTPHNIEAEQWLLGACLMRPEHLDDLDGVVEPAHFFRLAHRALWHQLQAMRAAGETIDFGTVASGLRRHRVPDLTPAEVSALVDGMPRIANAAAYAQIVRECWLRRELIRAGSRLIDEAHDVEQPVQSALEHAEQVVYGLGSRTVTADWTSAPVLAADVFTALETAHERRGRLSGLPTGLRDLDELTGGLQPGDLVLVGARPSLGKTALAVQIALHASKDVPVGIVSIEMPARQVMLRAVSSEAQVDSWRLRDATLFDVELRRVGEAVNAMASWGFHLIDAPDLNPLQIRSKLRQLRAKVGRDLGLVVIDYLQLMAPLPEHRRENRTSQVTGISRALKLMARELNVPFLVLAQLNRNVERTGDRVPTLADLRDSGALEQDADVVLLLHRPEAHQPNDPALAGKAQLIVAKHRNGPTGTVDLVWRKEFTKFVDAR